MNELDETCPTYESVLSLMTLIMRSRCLNDSLVSWKTEVLPIKRGERFTVPDRAERALCLPSLLQNRHDIFKGVLIPIVCLWVRRHWQLFPRPCRRDTLLLVEFRKFRWLMQYWQFGINSKVSTVMLFTGLFCKRVTNKMRRASLSSWDSNDSWVRGSFAKEAVDT